MDNTIGDNGIFRILLTCQYNNQFTVLFQYRSFHILDIIDTLFAELKGKIVCGDFSLLTGCYVYLIPRLITITAVPSIKCLKARILVLSFRNPIIRNAQITKTMANWKSVMAGL